MLQTSHTSANKIFEKHDPNREGITKKTLKKQANKKLSDHTYFAVTLIASQNKYFNSLLSGYLVS